MIKGRKQNVHSRIANIKSRMKKKIKQILPVPLSKHQILQCWQNSQNLTQTLTVLFRAVMYFQHMCISRRQLEQLRRPDQLTSGWTQPDALSQQLAKPRACTSLLGEGVTCCTQMPKCTFECFLKNMSRGKNPPQKNTMMRTSCCSRKHSSLSFGLQLEWADLLYHSAASEECPSMFQHFFTPPPLSYMLAQFMHVIDCSNWPETSTRLTSAGNYWPPLIVSQRCWLTICMSASAHLYVTYLRLIGFFHLFLVVPDTARRGK